MSDVLTPNTKAGLLALAKEHGIEVGYNPNAERPAIELTAPKGWCFGPELHVLVNGLPEGGKWSEVIASAIEDIYFIELVECDDDCSCRSGEDEE